MSSLSVTTKILKTMETSSSVGMFARDTGGCLISRLCLSRSKDEAKEISFAELSESAIFYFGAPALAKMGSKVFSTPENPNIGKFAKITTVFGLVLPLIYAIAPLRNLFTYSNSAKDKFAEVVELDTAKDKPKDDPEVEAELKAKSLLKKLGLVSGAIVASGLSIAALAKNEKMYQKLKSLIDGTVKHFDFTKEGDLTLKHYGALIYPASILGYFSASRDKYEIAENARRFSITVPLMFFGEKLIQNPIYKKMDKIFKTNVAEGGNIKTYKDILKLPQDKQKQMLKSKNCSFLAVFLINTMAIAAAVGLLNRIETKRKYNQDKLNAQG